MFSSGENRKQELIEIKSLKKKKKKESIKTGVNRDDNMRMEHLGQQQKAIIMKCCCYREHGWHAK